MRLQYIFAVIITFNFTYAYSLKPQTEQIRYNKNEYKRLVNKANEYAMKNQIDKSLETAETAYKICKNKKDALLIMARIYNFKKDYKNLREVAEKILQISPNNYLGNIYLANSYIKENKVKAKEILLNLSKKYKNDDRISEKLKAFDV
jgi:tetratricopeptide (TPR) repeat protein